MERVRSFLFRIYGAVRILPFTEIALALIALLIIAAFGISLDGLW